VPGEPEAAAERRAEERGIVIDEGHALALRELADRFDLPLELGPWPPK
jgi:LDH2 family malate/lactate/ureidoglycolate dehydrogenase